MRVRQLGYVGELVGEGGVSCGFTVVGVTGVDKRMSGSRYTLFWRRVVVS